jgi:hypothetical protein
VLLVDPLAHHGLRQLSDPALSAWNRAIGRCAMLRTDILNASELSHVNPEILGEWKQARIASPLPFGHCRFLERGTLWDYD